MLLDRYNQYVASHGGVPPPLQEPLKSTGQKKRSKRRMDSSDPAEDHIQLNHALQRSIDLDDSRVVGCVPTSAGNEPLDTSNNSAPDASESDAAGPDQQEIYKVKIHTQILHIAVKVINPIYYRPNQHPFRVIVEDQLPKNKEGSHSVEGAAEGAASADSHIPLAPLHPGPQPTNIYNEGILRNIW